MTENFTLREAIELAITTEQLGAQFYDRLQKKFHDENDLKEIFAQLAADEKTHEAQFKAILNQLPDKQADDQQEQPYQFLKATATSEFFHSDAFENVEQLKDSTEALGKAFSFEKATHQYYQAIRDVIGESPQLDAIINAEKNHVVTLMRVILSDAKFRGLADKW